MNMKFKKIVLLAAVLLISACNESSKSSDDELKPDPNPEVAGCGDSAPSKFDITDINVQILQAPEPKTYPRRVIGSSLDASVDTQYDGIVFSLESETQSLAAHKTKLPRAQKKGITFSLLNSAFACSPIPPSTDEMIIGMNIKSSSPFNDELAAGTILNEKFNVVFTHSETPYYDYDPINSGVIYYSLEKYLAQVGVGAGEVIQLKLNEEPQYAGNHIFFIEITLDSGDVFSMETSEVSLVKTL